MGDHVGDRVRRCRLWRGLTQQQLADLVGWSKSALSMLETGARGLDSRSRLRQLAEALRVAPTDLTGEPYPLDAPGLADAQAGVPALEVALMDHRIGDNTDREPRTLAELEAEVAAMATATRAADAVVLRTVPGLIMELQSYGRDDERALRLLTATCIQATHGLRRLGQVPLAWIAAERCAEAAALVGDPIIIASAEFARAHSRPTAGQGMARAGQAADRMPDRLVDTDPWAQEVYGMLRLTAALAAQVRGDTDGAEAQAEEAARVADVHGERATTWESFGPANVGVWRTTLAVGGRRACPGAGARRGAGHHTGGPPSVGPRPPSGSHAGDCPRAFPVGGPRTPPAGRRRAPGGRAACATHACLTVGAGAGAGDAGAVGAQGRRPGATRPGVPDGA